MERLWGPDVFARASPICTIEVCAPTWWRPALMASGCGVMLFAWAGPCTAFECAPTWWRPALVVSG